MIKGLYSAFTAMEAAWRYQEVLANNVANATTTGFKREVGAMQSFDDALLSAQAAVPAPFPARIQAIVGQIGTGHFLADLVTDFSGGNLETTGQELDFATDRGFFAVRTPDGQVFYTRDGHFLRDGEGNLVTPHGYFVLDAEGAPINLPPGPVEANADGLLSVGGAPVATLQLVDFTPAQLTRSGEAYFRAAEPGVPVPGGLRQGVLEASNTNMVEELTTLLAVQRTYQANQTVLARLDRTLDQAAGEVGRLA